MKGKGRGKRAFVKFKIRAYYSQERRKIWRRVYDSVGTRRHETLLEEMSFQPVVEDNSDVLSGAGLRASLRIRKYQCLKKRPCCSS